MEDDLLSLRDQLMNWLLTPLFVLWLFSTVVGYVATLNYANQPYDMALLERAQLIAGQLQVASTGREQDTLPSSPEPSQRSSGSRTYFTVTSPDGTFISGNEDISPPPLTRNRTEGPLFRNAERRGEKIRIVSVFYPERGGKGPFQIQVAETVDQRQALIRGIFANIVIPQLLLIFIAVVAVWFALKRGLAPLERLRREVAQRSRDDLSELDEAKAPLEVRPLIQAVNDLFGQLKEVMAAQRRFVADAAHQLRTPFAGLKTQAELALREQGEEERQHALNQILVSAEKGSHLVNQLLALARNEPGGQDTGNFAQLDLNQVAQQCTMDWVPQALAKGVDLGFEGGEGPLALVGDGPSLTEMLNNLIDNALRYSPAGSHVTVRTLEDEEILVLEVEDDGPGIPTEFRQRVFERFFRVLGSGQSGSGLGLAIVAEVAKRHGANVSLGEGRDGKGTVFRVTFSTRSAEEP